MKIFKNIIVIGVFMGVMTLFVGGVLVVKAILPEAVGQQNERQEKTENINESIEEARTVIGNTEIHDMEYFESLSEEYQEAYLIDIEGVLSEYDEVIDIIVESGYLANTRRYIPEEVSKGVARLVRTEHEKSEYVQDTLSVPLMVTELTASLRNGDVYP